MKKISILFASLLVISLFFIACGEEKESASVGSPLAPENQPHFAGKKQPTSEYVHGTDITDRLRSDLENGLDVTLPAGRFFVSESIIVFDYSGTVEGAGKKKTIIEAARGYWAMEDPLFGPPFRVTEMFALYFAKGDVTFKDMTIRVKRKAPAEVHNNPFRGERSTIDNAIVVAGVGAESDITVTFQDLIIDGAKSNDEYAFNNKNLIYPLVVIGWGGIINVLVSDCEISRVGDTGLELWWTGGSAIVKDNSFDDTEEIVISGTSYLCFQGNTLNGSPMEDNCPER